MDVGSGAHQAKEGGSHSCRHTGRTARRGCAGREETAAAEEVCPRSTMASTEWTERETCRLRAVPGSPVPHDSGDTSSQDPAALFGVVQLGHEPFGVRLASAGVPDCS